MFWGPEVDAFIAGGGDPIRLTEDEIGGRQDARLYLGTDESPPILDYAGSLHELSSEAEEVLEEWEVPLQSTAIESENSSNARPWWVALPPVVLPSRLLWVSGCFTRRSCDIPS